jgi:hypothetical protein
MWSLVSVRSMMVFVSEQDRCTVYAKHNIGSEIGRTQWYSKLLEARFDPFGDSANLVTR